MTWTNILGSALMFAGTVFSVLAAWGVVNFPSAIARMHASTKSASLGLALVALGAGVAAQSWGAIGVAGLVTVFLFATSPISGHLLGRAAYLAGEAQHLIRDDLTNIKTGPSEASEPGTRGFSAIRWLGLVVVWVLLWRDVSVGTVAAGVLLATLVEAVQRRYRPVREIHPWGLVIFLVRYIGMVVVSNLRVAWEVITPSNVGIQEAIVGVPLKTASLPVALLVANAVSYSPGTLVIELTHDPMVLYVHVLHFTTVEDVRQEVHRLEELVESAIGTSDPALES